MDVAFVHVLIVNRQDLPKLQHLLNQRCQSSDARAKTRLYNKQSRMAPGSPDECRDSCRRRPFEMTWRADTWFRLSHVYIFSRDAEQARVASREAG